MAWIYLLAAGVFEIGWPLGFKLSQQPEYRIAGIAGAIWSMGMSGWLLWLAQREIPIGTAYVVWTGIGGAGTFIIGVLFFGDPQSMARWVGVAMIVGGVAVLKLSH
jgi:quaternary ammonium compound-resistance protein SugE